MIQTPEDRRPPMTPQLARRIAVIGMLALAMFAIIFFRLWFLQVLSGNQYLAQAKINRVRDVSIAAPRGEIIDRDGATLVGSVPATAVLIEPPSLPVPLQAGTVAHPPPADGRLYDKLSKVLGIPTKPQSCSVYGYGVLRLAPVACEVAQQYVQVPFANVKIKTGVAKDVQYYLQERQNQYPGVSVTQVWTRNYPLGSLAAQLFGTVGPITASELKERRFRGYPLQSVIGQSGLEWVYNQYLQGTDGADRVQVDSLGNFAGYLSQREPIAGHILKLSLDTNIQRVGQQALAQSIAQNASSGGAFVAMNPVDGEVYGMGSLPSFDPSVFTKPISTKQYNALFGPNSGDPQLNRAMQSAGPTGSTFKPITATAALESGAWSATSIFDDTGQFCFSGQCRHNAGGAVDGALDLRNAIRVSSDDFFYNLGVLLNNPAPRGGALQQWARALGIGQKTGIDVGGEVSGTLPTPAWRLGRDRLEARCEKKHHVASCGIADGRPWAVGDNESLAVGQGDVQVTPLQLAVAYSAIANYGTVVRPHLGLDVQATDGTILQKIQPPPARHVNINPALLDTIREGLRDAASQPGGTSADVFGNFPEQVYGKTGTAQYNGQPDYAWYACFVPPSATSKPIVVVVTVERGGFGAVAAAPVAREILSQWFFGKPGAYQAGASQTL